MFFYTFFHFSLHFVIYIKSTLSLSGERVETLKILCTEWLHKNFGIAGEIKRAAIVGPENPIDLKLNLVGVAFEFQCPDGTTGDSVAFLDKDLVEWAPLLTIEETRQKKRTSTWT